jgi:guanylate cyclase
MQGSPSPRRSYLERYLDAVTSPDDSEDLRLQMSLLVHSSHLIMLAGFVWGALYFGFGEPVAGLIPVTYSVLSLISSAIFYRTHHYNGYRITQLTLILLLPFFLMVALGGYVNSSAVVLWSLLCPFGALLFARSEESPRWMILYLALVLIGGILQPFARESNNLPPPLIVPIFFVLNIGAVTGIAFMLLHYFVREKDRAHALLVRERQRSEDLLLNVLPEEIAPRLKADTGIIADHFDSASVLFADIEGSTPLFEKMQPDEMVDWLNQMFSLFDRLVTGHGLEKIRTIGDNYMVASGAPRRRADHAQILTQLALEMCEEVAALPPRHGNKIEIRVGINSGPLVAGVIGETKFHYDLWGDTVNTASRMESHGEAGRIQITENTYRLIQYEFECEPRGSMQIKGKGEMETWFVLGRKG